MNANIYFIKNLLNINVKHINFTLFYTLFHNKTDDQFVIIQRSNRFLQLTFISFYFGSTMYSCGWCSRYMNIGYLVVAKNYYCTFIEF